MKTASLITGISAVVVLAAFSARGDERSPDVDGAPAAATPASVSAADMSSHAAGMDAEWRRPEGPIRIALQAGHWKAADAPDEQAGLRTNGTRGGGKAEWEVNLGIAQRAALMLETEGYVVEILPTTIPPGYHADVFISIHADGSTSSTASGYRAAAPRRDRTGRAGELAAVLMDTYGEATGLPVYPLITRRMRSYYAFNSRRYRHALDPMTVGVILETGFLTSPRDRRIIIDEQDRAARGIANGVVRFLNPPMGVPVEQLYD